MSTPGLSDEALLAGMAVGDEQAAAGFVRRYQNRIYGLAVSMISDPGVAEDVAQEAFVRVWRHAQVFDARRGSVATWVLTITRNLAIDALRLRRATATDPDELAALGLVSEERLPEETATSSESVTEVKAVLATLPAEQRRAVVLAAIYGRTAMEIGEQEGIPLGTAKTRIRAAMTKLRVAMVEGADRS